jgi:hypothetical protein
MVAAQGELDELCTAARAGDDRQAGPSYHLRPDPDAAMLDGG